MIHEKGKQNRKREVRNTNVTLWPPSGVPINSTNYARLKPHVIEQIEIVLVVFKTFLDLHKVELKLRRQEIDCVLSLR